MIRHQMPTVFEPSADPAWVVREDGYDPLRASSVESRFSISNGFLGVRGARAILWGERWTLPPHTYVAGWFDTAAAEGAVSGLVPAPDWLAVRISTPECSLTQAPGPAPAQQLTLDMKRGLVIGDSRHVQSTGLDLRVRTLRLVSRADRGVGLQLIRFEVTRGEADLVMEASFEGVDLGLAPDQLTQDLGVWRTRQSGKWLAMAANASLQIDDQPPVPPARGSLTWSWTWAAKAGQVAAFQRLVAVTRDDEPASSPGDAAVRLLGAAKGRGWRATVSDHETAWAERWHCSDIEIDGDPDAQTALRFATYHLISAANPADDRVSIGARALTGDDYLGHVFWDTEIFLLPFYIFTWPAAARALLLYRFRTLDASRARAAAMGWRGALYAWESADTGEDATPRQLIGPDRRVVTILTGTQEQHISADVAYAVWQYWQATGDEAFLLEAGAEIILETGRFWASRSSLEPDGLRHIRGVLGPDEYHEDIDDNAFTNIMARWNILRALEVANLLEERWPQRWAELSGRLALLEEELRTWRAVAETMATGLDPRTGIFEQFEGYFGLEKIDLSAYAGRSVPMDVVLGRDRTARSQVVKQADVVALLALLPEEFAGQSAADNFRFYEPRCGHGSSLSRPMHGLAAARLGLSDLALDYFRGTAATDLADTHVAIGGGIHIATQGGLWMAAVFGFAGLSMRADTLAIEPRLPKGWKSLQFRVQWRGRTLTCKMTVETNLLEIVLEAGEATAIWVNGRLHPIEKMAAIKLV
jgi:trehalose/maltose hydrolase-like predicted phosphorylase